MQSKKKTIGFIGLGLMGQAFTNNLMEDGYKIFESDFTQVTEFKAFDQSWNGNHLVKFDEANII